MSAMRDLALQTFAFAAIGLLACAPDNGDSDSDTGSDNDSSDNDENDDNDGFEGFIDGSPPSIYDGGPPVTPQCGALQATVRDFTTDHPDFETFDGDYVFPGLVNTTLGADGKPVHAWDGPTAQTNGPEFFAQWYNDTPGVNQSMPLTITLTDMGGGLHVYDNKEFFPVDGQGFGNEGWEHNFHFTTEIHTLFVYKGGEKFTFEGDDDLWLFINKKLAIDLGGLHPPALGTVDLDARAAELGIEIGKQYEMAIFHAERHTTWSNFHIETTISCFEVP
jgi:fibro-slime domain-containing protein